VFPKGVVFAANATYASGAGHLMRLIEVAKNLPDSVKKFFVGSVDIPWIDNLKEDIFIPVSTSTIHGQESLVIIDSYDPDFCTLIRSSFPHSNVVQIADRYSFLLPSSHLIFMDLPFVHQDKGVEERVIAHGIEYLPKRKFHSSDKLFQSEARRVLITTGGATDQSFFAQLFEELSRDMYQHIEFNFIGQFERGFANQGNFKFHEPGLSFDKIAGYCDTAISSSGTTMWDLLANQMVVGLSAIVENQLSNYQYATSSYQALPIFCEDSRILSRENLEILLFDHEARRNLRSNIIGRYDFLGASRVCELISKHCKGDNIFE
jgi:spore coat polysaccharide biosynthesis predicted glycosyltransferase SpsG